MLARLIPVLLLFLAAPAFAADDKGPLLSELMKQKGLRLRLGQYVVGRDTAVLDW